MGLSDSTREEKICSPLVNLGRLARHAFQLYVHVDIIRVVQDKLWLIGGDVVAYWWRCGGLLLGEM